MLSDSKCVVEDPQSPEELARIHEQLWQTVLQFGNFSASQERNRIARDLHDSLGQALTALNIQLQTAVKLWQLDPERAEQFLAEAQRLGSTAVQEVRQTVRTLRTDCPDDQSIDTLIASLVESFHRSTGVLPTVKLNLAAPMPPEVVTPVYRIVQEGLNNICKYAQATEVTVQLSTTPTSLGLIIEDNGRGFDLEQTVTGFGLRGMQERVSLLRGRFQMETQPGAGCRIRVVMPLRVLSLQDSQGLVPPPIATPEDLPHRDPQRNAPPVPAIPAPAPAPPAAETGGMKILEPRSEEPVLTPMGDRDLEHAFVPLPGESTATALSRPDLTPPPGLVLTAAQSERLTQILLEWVGPIAPILLQQAIAQAHWPTDLIATLAVHVPSQQQGQFAHQMQAVLSQAAAPPPSVLNQAAQLHTVLAAPSTSVAQPAGGHALMLNAELTHYCEQELTALIGPIAPFLMQEVLATSPHLSVEELVDRLATNIPNPQTAAQFKQRILAYAA